MQLVVRTIRAANGSYVATCPSLPNCVSCGKTREEVLAKHRDTVRGYVAAVTNFVPESLEFNISSS